MSDRKYLHAIVTLTSGYCDEYPDRRCVSEVHLFDTQDEAYAFMDTCPHWMAPHNMLIPPEQNHLGESFAGKDTG